MVYDLYLVWGTYIDPFHARCGPITLTAMNTDEGQHFYVPEFCLGRLRTDTFEIPNYEMKGW